jgi:3,4-dihydroxy 2-butanone 4-phosphate synthase/GTP cyclohydrolase II
LKVYPFAKARLPTHLGDVDVSVFRNDLDEEEAVVVSRGIKAGDEPIFVRIHCACFTSEVLGSLKCDCKRQLDLAFCRIAAKGQGLMIYLRQEGRGIGLGNKIRAYALQNQGADTIEANHLIGFPRDLRDFKVAALILKELGILKIQLNTNNPDKIEAMTSNGIDIVEIIPSLAEVNEHNRNYLETKLQKLGHESLRAILRNDA